MVCYHDKSYKINSKIFRRVATMKKILSAQELIKDYIEYATIEGETKLNGDYRKGNRMVKKLNKIFEALKENRSLAQYVLGDIMECASIRARSIAAADAFRLNVCVDKAVEVQEEISKRTDIGIWAFSAEMCLKTWRGEIPNRTL